MSVVPDLIRLSQVPINYEQEIQTDLLEPVVQQEATATGTGFCRFDLQQKGFLHSQSKIFISLVPLTNGRAFVPPNIGIGSVIQRARLVVGNQVLNEISDWSNLHAIKSTEIDNENNKEREQYVTGRMINHEFAYRDEVGGKSVFSYPTSGRYLLDNGRNYGLSGGVEAKIGQVKPFALMNQAQPTQSPTYSVDISDLFPFLKTHSLPLYMIDQQLSIELVWARTTDRALVPTGVAAGVEYKIDRNELKMCADYIFYTDNDAMTRYATANPVIEFAFPDYRLSKSTLTVSQLSLGQVRNLGMANRQVSRILTTVTNDNITSASMLGKYNATAPSRASPTLAQGGLRYNVRYNDRFEFPTSITNEAELFTHFTQSESIPFVTREEYSRAQRGLSTEYVFEGHDQSSGAVGLSGNFLLMGTRLTGGRVGVRGIELHLQMGGAVGSGQEMPDPSGGGDTPYTVRTYCEYLRLARLSQGGMSVFNA